MPVRRLFAATSVSAVLLCTPIAFSQEQQKKRCDLEWREIEPGYSLTRCALGDPSHVLKPEVMLLRFDLKHFSFRLASARTFNKKRSDIRTLTRKHDAVAGINAHFFDPQHRPLGVAFDRGRTFSEMHRGGRLLTGVFYIQDDFPHIVHRSSYKEPPGTSLALQAGPRLIAGGKALTVASPDSGSRRSGIAVTRSGEVIIFATILRFPGTSLQQLQDMLLDSRLEVTDALNLDGGGSSQLFITKNSGIPEDTFITGGDPIPVGLVVGRKKERE